MMHVDDCEVCGEPRELQKFEQSLEKEFGSVKEQSWNFRHCGIEYIQSKDLSRLQHSQYEFINAMKYYPLGNERGKQVASSLNAQEATGFRSVLGGLQWASHTRADHVAECSRLQGKRANPTVQDMKDANALLRRCKDTAKEAALVFRAQPKGPKRVLVFTDASLNSVSKTNSKTCVTKEEKRTQAG